MFQRKLLAVVGVGFLLSFFIFSSKAVAVTDGVAVSALIAGTDNLIGATSNWSFSATSSQELVRGDVVKFVFPDLVGSTAPFVLGGASASSFSGAIDLYQNLTTNLLLNPSFESATSSWTQQIDGTAVVSVTTTVANVGGTSAIQITNDNASGDVFLYQSLSTTPGANYSVSFYARGLTGGETARVLIMDNNAGIICPEDNPYSFNFVTHEWACPANLAELLGVGAPFLFDSVLTNEYARFSTTTIFATTTSMEVAVLTGGAAAFNNQTILFDAVQFESGTTVNTYETQGVSANQSSRTLFGFVSSTIPAGSIFNVNVQNVVNPVGPLTSFANLIWDFYAGTPVDTSQPWGSLTTTKALASSTAVSVGRAGGPIVADISTSITPSSALSSATNVDYTFVFTATSSIPVGGKIALNFPSTFNIAGATVALADNSSINGAGAPAPQITNGAVSVVTTYGRNQILLTTSNAVTIAHDTLTVKVGGITNPATTGTFSNFFVFTTKANGGLLDGSTSGYTDETIYGSNVPTSTVQLFTPGVTLSSTSATVAEDSGTATYTVVLTSAPANDVVIAVAETSADFSVSPTSLTFTSVNWATPQTVTITATSDSLVEGTETSSITHTATSVDGNYNSIAIFSITVTITDNDVAGNGGGGGGGPSITGPYNLVLSINSNATSTSNQIVTLNLGAANATQMMVSENSAFTGAIWESVVTSKSWIFSSATGTKYIFVKYRDGYGSVSSVVSASITLLTPTSIIPVVPVTPVVPIVAPVVPPIEVPIYVEVVPILTNPESKIIISDINDLSLQPATSLIFKYSYTNDTEEKLRIRLVRQVLNAKGTVIASTRAYRNIKAGEQSSVDVNQFIGRYWTPGEFRERIRIYNSQGQIIEENSFNFVVEKLKYKYLAKGGLGEDNAIVFDQIIWEKNKTDVRLPAVWRLAYSYTNQTDIKQDIRMLREIVNTKGEVVYVSRGHWRMDPGEMYKMITSQSLLGTLLPGDYLLRVRALDYKTGELLAENSANFAVELK